MEGRQAVERVRVKSSLTLYVEASSIWFGFWRLILLQQFFDECMCVQGGLWLRLGIHRGVTNDSQKEEIRL